MAHTGVVDIRMPNVSLHLLTFEETERILRFQLLPGETWAPGYPSVEQRDYLEAYLVELRSPRSDTKWQAQLRRGSDGLVIGGAGVTGPPDERGSVVVGFEVDRTVIDEDYGVEIVEALLRVARDMGATRAHTSAPIGDARDLAYLRNGFVETSRDLGSAYFAIDLSHA